MYNVQDWQHVFKLDPAKAISDEALEQICESGTDAIIVGGTDNVTMENVLDLMSRVRRYPLPCVLEISNVESVIPGFDRYLVPSVLNTAHSRFQTGQLQEALKAYGHMIQFSELSMEGYVILNPDSKVSQYTEANTELSHDDISAYAMMIEQLLHFPVMYIEYSGTFGDVEMLKSAKSQLQKTRLFYGGGIDDLQKAKTMLSVADTIVVGNIIYTDLKSALSTVKAKKEV